MKKGIFTITLVLIMTLSINAGDCLQEVKVFYNDMLIEFSDISPVIDSGRTMVPFRILAQSIGVSVDYIAETREIVGMRGQEKVEMTVGQTTAYINNEPHNMLVAPKIIEGRALIPLRDFSEAFGLEVTYSNYVINIRREYEMNMDMKVDGFYALGYQGRSSWEELFGDSYPNIGDHPRIIDYDNIHLGWYELLNGQLVSSSGKHGFYKPVGHQDVIFAINEYNKNAYMMVFGEEDGSLTTSLADETIRNKLLASIKEEVVKEGYVGVNLDIEGLGLTSNESRLEEIRETYLKFVADLREILGEGLELIVTVPPGNSAYQGYNYQGLSQYSDKLIIMAYDYHDRNTPSATAPIQKVREGVKIIVEQTVGNKLSLGVRLPAVRYQDVNNTAGLELQTDPHEEAIQGEWLITHPYLDSVYFLAEEKGYTIKWHPEYAVSYLEFYENGNQNIVFMENRESILRKIEIVKEYDLEGLSLWRIGTVPTFIYEVLEEVR